MRLVKFILRLVVNVVVYVAVVGLFYLAAIYLLLQGLRFWGASI